MSAQIPGKVPAAKGAVCYALDIVSKGPRARYRLARLRRALRRLPPNKRGLAECFDEHLLRYVFKKKATREKIVNHLNEFWFNPNSPRPYFPGVPVAKVYADGVVQAINLALGRVGRVV